MTITTRQLSVHMRSLTHFYESELNRLQALDTNTESDNDAICVLNQKVKELHTLTCALWEAKDVIELVGH